MTQFVSQGDLLEEELNLRRMELARHRSRGK